MPAKEARAEWRELVRHKVHPRLGGLVAGIVGYRESALGSVERLQPAGSLLPVVMSFGDGLDVVALSDGVGAGRSYCSFVAGFMPGHAATRFAQSQACVQIYLTPLGAYRILGHPGSQTARRVMDLDSVAPRLGRSLPDRLASTNTWEERFRVVEAILLEVAESGPEPDAVVTWLWQQVEASGGTAHIGELVARSGWSHRHATTRFRAQIGVTPKAAARVIRFERAARDLAYLPLAEVAFRHGYADQSHLTREVVRLAGEAPQVFARAHRPTAHTALDDSMVRVATGV